MSPDQKSQLTLVRLPGRLTADQAATELGCNSHDIPILVLAGLLKPLGKPSPNAVKYFFRDEILKLAGNEAWLSRATSSIYGHWRANHAKRGTGTE